MYSKPLFFFCFTGNNCIKPRGMTGMVATLATRGIVSMCFVVMKPVVVYTEIQRPPWLPILSAVLCAGSWDWTELSAAAAPRNAAATAPVAACCRGCYSVVLQQRGKPKLTSSVSSQQSQLRGEVIEPTQIQLRLSWTSVLSSWIWTHVNIFRSLAGIFFLHCWHSIAWIVPQKICYDTVTFAQFVVCI